MTEKLADVVFALLWALTLGGLVALLGLSVAFGAEPRTCYTAVVSQTPSERMGDLHYLGVTLTRPDGIFIGAISVVGDPDVEAIQILERQSRLRICLEP